MKQALRMVELPSFNGADPGGIESWERFAQKLIRHFSRRKTSNLYELLASVAAK